MTCFRLNQRKTVRQWCLENGVNYNSVYNRIEQGMEPEYACREALKYKGKRFSHPRLFYKERPIRDIYRHDNKSYALVLRKIRDGMTTEEAIQYERRLRRYLYENNNRK